MLRTDASAQNARTAPPEHTRHSPSAREVKALLETFGLSSMRKQRKALGFRCLVPGSRGCGLGAAWEGSGFLPGPGGAAHLYTAIPGSSPTRGIIHLTSISSPMKASRMATSSGLLL